MKIVKPSVRLVHATPFPEHVIEAMGRVCYQSQPRKVCPHGCGGGVPSCTCGGYGTSREGAQDFVRMILQRGHESVIEHVSAGFLITCDRGVTHELVRHRLAAFSQESTRYCDYTGDRFGGELSFIQPPGLVDPAGTRFDRTAEGLWMDAVEEAETVYLYLRSRGVPPEIARSVLPNSLKSQLGMTCNAREWRHVLRLRTAPAAHPQMREVAAMLAAELKRWSPVLFEEF
jgi:thymidylate synthase (FAD)